DLVEPWADPVDSFSGIASDLVERFLVVRFCRKSDVGVGLLARVFLRHPGLHECGYLPLPFLVRRDLCGQGVVEGDTRCMGVPVEWGVLGGGGVEDVPEGAKDGLLHVVSPGVAEDPSREPGALLPAVISRGMLVECSHFTVPLPDR